MSSGRIKGNKKILIIGEVAAGTGAASKARRINPSADIKGFPQLLLRIGYAQDVKPTPLRPIEEILRSRE